MEVNLPSTLKTIEDMAFANCPSIVSINIPNGMTTVGKQMFDSCENLKAVTLAEYAPKGSTGEMLAKDFKLKFVAIPVSK